MILVRYFIWIILFLNLYPVVMGDLRKLSWSLKRNEKERLFETFLTNAESHLMQNCPGRQTTIIAPNNQLLRAATPFFKDRPYYVGTNSKALVQSREYAHQSCVFVFIDAIDYDYLSSIFSYLPSDYKTKVQIISKIYISDEKINIIFGLAHEHSVVNVKIISPRYEEFRAFKAYPSTSNSKREIRSSYIWAPDSELQTCHVADNSRRI